MLVWVVRDASTEDTRSDQRPAERIGREARGAGPPYEEQIKSIVAGDRGWCPCDRFASHVYLTPSSGESCGAAVGASEARAALERLQIPRNQ
jgi:hypothetical protein